MLGEASGTDPILQGFSRSYFQNESCEHLPSASHRNRPFSIGSHARTHRLLSSLSAADLREEIAQSAADVQRETGIAPAALAYPYGIASTREQKEAARVYDLAVGAELSVIGDESNRFMLPRIDAYYLRKPGVLESFGSPRFDRFLKLRNRGRQLRTSVNRLLGQGGA